MQDKSKEGTAPTLQFTENLFAPEVYADEAAFFRIQAEANEARSEAARQQPRTEDGRRLAAKSDSGTTCSTTSLDRHKGREAKADLAGTNRGAVQRAAKMRKLATETGRPEIIEDVKAGKVKAHAALKDLEESKRRIELQRPVQMAGARRQAQLAVRRAAPALLRRLRGRCCSMGPRAPVSQGWQCVHHVYLSSIRSILSPRATAPRSDRASGDAR